MVHRLPCVINCYYGSGLLCNQSLNRVRIYVICVRVNISKHGHCTTVQSTVCTCREGNRSGDNLISLTNACCYAGHMQSRCSIGTSYGMLCTCDFTQLRFKLINLGTAGQVV